MRPLKTKYIRMKKVAILFALLIPVFIAVISFNYKNEIPEESLKTINPFNNASLSFETFKTEGKGWGFDVYINGSLFIHQDKIPAPGVVKGYESEDDAVKVAGLIISKIKQNTLPPLISVSELDSIGIK